MTLRLSVQRRSLLSRAGARCWSYGQPVSPTRSPHTACGSHRALHVPWGRYGAAARRADEPEAIDALGGVEAQGWRFACNGACFTGASSVAVTRYRAVGSVPDPRPELRIRHRDLDEALSDTDGVEDRGDQAKRLELADDLARPSARIREITEVLADAPQLNGAGRPEWGYALVAATQPDDVDFHWHTSRAGRPALVGWSVITGPLTEVQDYAWMPQGTRGRARGYGECTAHRAPAV
jgi:hypothetical protein